MRNIEELQSNLGHIDLYLLDQILKNRYDKGDSILEAGCGHGRNLGLLLRLGFDVHALDKDPERVLYCQTLFSDVQDKIRQGDLVKMPYSSGQFHHIISSAVFHFSESEAHFRQLFGEHMRVLRSGGTIFIRMTTAFGLDPKNNIPKGNGKYILPDGTERFLLSYTELYSLMNEYNLKLVEPVKTVNVHEMRAMGLIILQKN